MVNVTNESDLQACYTDPTANYTLTADITVTANFYSYIINNYSGTFDGANYIIINMQITAIAQATAMFKGTMSGTIQNLNMTNYVMTVGGSAYNYIALLCVGVTGTISHCTLEGSISNGGNYYLGGCAVQLSSGTIEYVDVDIDISGSTALSRYNGGLVAQLSNDGGTIDHCTTTGSYTSNKLYFGGILGYNNGYDATISNCSSSMSILNGDHTGGIVGYSVTGILTITGCSFSGTIENTGGSGKGCIIGSANNLAVSNCYVDGASITSGRSYRTGGFIGSFSSGTIENCYVTNTDIVKTDIYTATGGFVGQIGGGTIQNCYTTNSVTVSSTNSLYVGGFVGTQVGGTIQDCYSEATVTAIGQHGGFIGRFETDGTLQRCYCDGLVTVDSSGGYDNIGGFAGIVLTPCVIDNCYSNSQVGDSTHKVGTHIGGFVGNLTGEIQRCYCSGNIYQVDNASEQNCGGFVGICQATGVIQDCYSVGLPITYDSTDVGEFCGENAGTISDCGCVEDASLRAVGNPAGDVTYMKADPTTWRDPLDPLYTDGTNVWDIGYALTDKSILYPKLGWQTPDTEDYLWVVSPLGGSNSIFFGCHF